MPKKIIKLPEVIRTTGLSKSTIYKLISEGKFPKNIHLTSKSTGWVEDEIQYWLKEKITASRAESLAQFQAPFINNESEKETKYLALIAHSLSNYKKVSTRYIQEKLDITDVVARIQKLRRKYQMDIQEITGEDGDIVYMLPKGLCCGVKHEP